MKKELELGPESLATIQTCLFLADSIADESERVDQESSVIFYQLRNDVLGEVRMLRLSNLEMLRFIAALWVVATHSTGYVLANSDGSILGATLFLQGGYGVDLFFVVSGFVIALTQLRSPKRPRQFITNRMIRIVPAYWVVTLCTVMFVMLSTRLGFSSEAFEGMSISWVLASIGFLSQPILGVSPIVYQGWTLEYEMFFYLAVAIGVLVFRNSNYQLLLGVAIVALAIAFVPGFSPRAMQFILGVVAAVLFIKVGDRNSKKRIAIALMASGISLAAMEIWFLNLIFPEVLTLGISFSAIVLSAALLPQLKWAIWLKLGEASYAVYLWQVITVPVTFFGLSSVLGWEGLENLLFWIVLLLTQLTGMAFEKFVDSPMRLRIRRLVTYF